MTKPDVIEGRTDASSGYPKVLLVDDHQVNLTALCELLRRDDMKLLCAKSGAEALELLLLHDVALALIDVQMPEMDGFELAELMRGVERAKQVPIIFVTAGSREERYRFRGYEAGAVDFLYKPIEPDVLKSKVNVFLAIDRQRRELTRLLRERTEAERRVRESEQRLQQWNERLEQRVAERTQKLVESQQRLRAMALELNLAEQRERRRIATEMHDHLQQTLVLGKLKLGGAKRLVMGQPPVEMMIHETEEIFAEALQYTRALVAELSPSVLREHGLSAGLTWLGEYMKKHDLAVTVEVPEDQTLNLPEDQIALLFQSARELLMNAWKHAGTGKATVTMRHERSQLLVQVSDEGVGFDCAATAEESATGGLSSKFGLFSIRERMSAIGGSFEIESAPNKGTRGMLRLPLAGTGGVGGTVQAEGAKKNLSSTLQPPASRIRLLLVDDHAMMRQGLRAMLEGYEDVQVVGEAVDGRDAVRLVEKLLPAIVVMDINMPTMNGIEATREIKARYPNIAVIGLSVNADHENRDAMAKAGAATLLTKEAAVEHLYQTMQKVLKNICPVV
ncbi:MAG: response regulator [Nitrospira sp.]|nr:response regulator [Nitrospira sp.]